MLSYRQCDASGGLRQRLQPMISSISRRYSLDEYRAIEEKAEGRSEYRDGEIISMAGETLKHSHISSKINSQKQDN